MYNNVDYFRKLRR